MNRITLRIISIALAFIGVVIIIFSVYPIVEYESSSRKRFPKLVSPISPKERYFILSAPFRDFSNINNWSNEYKSTETTEENGVEIYYLSIPKLKILNALVSEGGEDLSKNLIQFPGTARPGQTGNAIIFGHSVLPVFFNPNNYMTIFSTIPKLEEGDEIYVNIKKIEYKFVVTEMYEVEPDNINILDQRLNNSYLSLVTCVPPGHPLKPRRLVVKSILTKI